MPTFADVPFDMGEMGPPRGMPESLVRAIEKMYVSLVYKAEDLITVDVLMDPEDSPGEMSESEIDICRLGMTAAITVMMEQMMVHDVIDIRGFAAYLNKLVS